MDPLGDQQPKHYYSVLGLGSDASEWAIRAAYRTLAMKWHPDKCSGLNRTEAKVKFQEIQEAYAVLSDEQKKLLYDLGLYDPKDDDEDVEGLSNFMSEMSKLMTEMQTSEGSARNSGSFEELQQLFISMFGEDMVACNSPNVPSPSSVEFSINKG